MTCLTNSSRTRKPVFFRLFQNGFDETTVTRRNFRDRSANVNMAVRTGWRRFRVQRHRGASVFASKDANCSGHLSKLTAAGKSAWSHRRGRSLGDPQSDRNDRNLPNPETERVHHPRAQHRRAPTGDRPPACISSAPRSVRRSRFRQSSTSCAKPGTPAVASGGGVFAEYVFQKSIYAEAPAEFRVG